MSKETSLIVYVQKEEDLFPAAVVRDEQEGCLLLRCGEKSYKDYQRYKKENPDANLIIK